MLFYFILFYFVFVRRTIESGRGVFNLFEVDDSRDIYAEVYISSSPLASGGG